MGNKLKYYYPVSMNLHALHMHRHYVLILKFCFKFKRKFWKNYLTFKEKQPRPGHFQFSVAKILVKIENVLDLEATHHLGHS